MNMDGDGASQVDIDRYGYTIGFRSAPATRQVIGDRR